MDKKIEELKELLAVKRAMLEIPSRNRSQNHSNYLSEVEDCIADISCQIQYTEIMEILEG